MPDVDILECTTSHELVVWFANQLEAQPVHLEVDLYRGTMLCAAGAQGATAAAKGDIPAVVVNGFVRRWRIPALTADAANRMMHELAPLVERIVAGWSRVWDGSNWGVQLNEDAAAAVTAISRHLVIRVGLGEPQNHGFAQQDLVVVWSVDALADKMGSRVTGDLTDEQVDDVGESIAAELSAAAPSGVAICPHLHEWLLDRRDRLQATELDF